MRQERDLTKGAIVKSLWLFALPLMFGNVLQQFYNLVDTWVVGRYLGKRALAAVGASYTLMTFLTSVVIGLCLGAGAFFAMAYGRREKETFRNGIFMSFTAIGGLSIVLTILLYGFVRPLTYLLQVPAETVEDMVTYLIYVFAGFFATFLYNYFASVLRSIGNSVLPLVFLGISVALNIGLDLLFVVTFSFGIAGAAVATVISQYTAGIGLMLYFLFRYSDLCPAKKDFTWEKKNFRQILSLSGFTCLQQSVMNFGILMIQGLVNSFGTTIMAAFSVAVKIDTIAYMPVQDFGNAFSFFVAQNYGAVCPHPKRISAGTRQRIDFLPCNQRGCLWICRLADGIFYKRRQCCSGCRRQISAGRRRFLCWNRYFVFTLWILPRSGQAGYFGGPYHNLTGNESNSCLCTHRPFPNRRDRNLGGDTNRVGTR